MQSERRIVTVLFADLVGFTSLSERLDPEDLRSVQAAYFAAVRAVIERQRGQLEKFIGDAVMAVFGVPRSSDDDVHRAVSAGLELIRAVGDLGPALGLPGEALHLRVGINSGPVVYAAGGPDEGTVTGDVVNTAARLQTAAQPDTVLVGLATSLAVEDAFELSERVMLELKGKQEPVPAMRVIARREEPSREVALRRLRAPMVGRDAELAQLLSDVREATAGGRTRSVLVAAPPGSGKSRLLHELGAAAAATGGVAPSAPIVLRARCRPDGLAPFEPVAQLMLAALEGMVTIAEGEPSNALAPGTGGRPTPIQRLSARLDTAGIDEADRGVVEAEVGRLLRLTRDTSAGREPAVVFTAWERAFGLLADGRTCVWIIEDLHWASADLVAYLAFLAAPSNGQPRLVVASARPALLERLTDRSGWQPRVMHLAPLVAVDIASLTRALAGGALTDDVIAALVERANGNPLFVEEVLRSWILGGSIDVDSDGRLQPVAHLDVEIPTTVQAVYAGQIDDLPGAARQLLRHAAVAGRRFPDAGLASLDVAEPERGLAVLSDRAFLAGPEPDVLVGDSHVFRHAVLRDAAYEGLSRADRARLHLAYAGWLSDMAADRDAAQYAELIARHLAVALRAAPALGPDVVPGQAKAVVQSMAAAWFERAGLAAVAASAYQTARDLFGQTLDHTASDDARARARRMRHLAETLRRTGELQQALDTFQSAAAIAAAAGDAVQYGEAALGYEETMFALRRPRVADDTSSLLLAAALERSGTASPMASRLAAALGRAAAYAGQQDRGLELCDRAVHLAELRGDHEDIAYALLARRAAIDGPRDLEARLRDSERAVAAAHRGNDLELEVEANRLRLMDLLERGDIHGADDTLGRLDELIERLARPAYFWYPPSWRGMRALVSGDLDAAETAIESSFAAASRWGFPNVARLRTFQTWLLRREQGRLADWRPELARGVGHDDSWVPVLVAVDGELGRPDGTVHLERWRSDRYALLPADRARSTALSLIAIGLGARWRSGHPLEHFDRAAAEDLYPELLPWSGQAVVPGFGAACIGAADHYLGLFAAILGRTALAREHLEAAVAANDAMECIPYAIRARLDLAALLRNVDREEPASARSLVAAAGRIAEGRGLIALEREIRQAHVGMVKTA